MARIFALIGSSRHSPILERFRRDRRGNVAMIFGLVSIPLLFAVAMGIDYANNARKWSQMNAAADAAALAAVSQQLLNEPDAVAQAVGQDMFSSQVAGMSNVVFNPASDLNITIVDTVSPTTGLLRTATVNYSAKANNIFAGILGQPNMNISGSAKGDGVETAQHQLLPAARQFAVDGHCRHVGRHPTDGRRHPGTKRCGFACHESNPMQWEVAGNPLGAAGTPYANGVDNFTLAKNYMTPPVMLRIDLVNAAVLALIQTAQQTAQTTQATYQISVNTFDVGVRSAIPSPPAARNTVGALTDLGTAYQYLSANPIQQLEVYDDFNLTATDPHDTNADTDWDDAIAGINAAMPNPGNGTNLPGDTPQEVLFVVTDGVEDEATSGGRDESLMSPSTCTTIKNRGIRIAVLYTEYLPLPTNDFYSRNIAPFQPNIGADLQSCASPNLFFEVTVDQDISAAMVALFKETLPRSVLTQ